MSKKQFRQRLARLLEIQNSHSLPGNWDQSKYMLGLYNGIELSLAVLTETDPEFRELPDQIIEEIS